MIPYNKNNRGLELGNDFLGALSHLLVHKGSIITNSNIRITMNEQDGLMYSHVQNTWKKFDANVSPKLLPSFFGTYYVFKETPEDERYKKVQSIKGTIAARIEKLDMCDGSKGQIREIVTGIFNVCESLYQIKDT